MQMTNPEKITPAQVLERIADWLEAREAHRDATHALPLDDQLAAQEAMIQARAKVLELSPATLRAQAIEQEGVEAGLQGCVGTHNPYLFADEVKRKAWERGNKRVRDLLERSYPYQAEALALLRDCDTELDDLMRRVRRLAQDAPDDDDTDADELRRRIAVLTAQAPASAEGGAE